MEETRLWDLSALYQAQYGTLFALAYRLVRQRERAEDLVQDVFCLAVLHRDRLAAHPNPPGWLVCTLKHLASNEVRLAVNRLTVPLEEELIAAEAIHPPLETLLPAGLSVRDRQVLLWRMEEELPYEEMARRLGLTETGCRSRVARAVARCRLLLAAE